MSKIHTFSIDDDGNPFGYHVECVSENILNDRPMLSMGTLRNEKPLFLGLRLHDWFPLHVKNVFDDYQVVKVTFKPVNLVRYHHNKDFRKLYYMAATKDKPTCYEVKFKPEGQRLIDDDIELFILDITEDLWEAFLINPKDNVINIEEVEVRPKETTIKIDGKTHVIIEIEKDGQDEP